MQVERVLGVVVASRRCVTPENATRPWVYQGNHVVELKALRCHRAFGAVLGPRRCSKIRRLSCLAEPSPACLSSSYSVGS